MFRKSIENRLIVHQNASRLDIDIPFILTLSRNFVFLLLSFSTECFELKSKNFKRDGPINRVITNCNKYYIARNNPRYNCIDYRFGDVFMPVSFTIVNVACFIFFRIRSVIALFLRFLFLLFVFL